MTKALYIRRENSPSWQFHRPIGQRRGPAGTRWGRPGRLPAIEVHHFAAGRPVPGHFSYASTGGTADTTTVGTGAEAVLSPGQWRLEPRAHFLHTRTDNTTRAQRLTSQVRTARKVGDRAELFARGTYLRNTFAGIDQSLDGAAGVTALLLQGQPQRFSFDSGFGYIGEDRRVVRGRYLRTFDTGVRHQWEFAKRNTISNDASFKTDVDRTSDWRVSHVAALAGRPQRGARAEGVARDQLPQRTGPRIHTRRHGRRRRHRRQFLSGSAAAPALSGR
ncbi:Putative salt-induced outer membrane protein [Luteitalea pratensis]|uniref:Salt-induced outer membrane protein n=1 Tax=Luteitalea pratensis TaxID=1855912 RepID=A0A143PP58_LUTPR|nr:Putative salt-induced outer membrane protein [Luteitalea pratensis]